MDYLHSKITSIILKGFYAVCQALPFGLDKDVYRKALNIELELLELSVKENVSYPIIYKEMNVGDIKVETVIDNSVGLILLNNTTDITDQDITNVRSIIKQIPLEVILILNFGIEANHKRIFLGNDFKRHYKTDITDMTAQDSINAYS